MKKGTQNDIAYGVAKAILGSVPIIGAAASELLQLIVTPPLERRRDKWMAEVGQRLKELEEKQIVNLENLATDELFIDVVLKTTQLALLTSQQDKIEYFKNAVLNAAVDENFEISEAEMFLKLISDFTVWHIRILKLFDDPEKWFKINDKTIPNYLSGSLSAILDIAYPELKSKREFTELIWGDLSRAGLHNSGALHVSMSSSGLMQQRTTNLGQDFLSFIAENPLN